MRATEPLPLHHSWPLEALAEMLRDSAPADPTAGRWRCDLDGDGLTWDDTVFDLFGLPRDALLTRELAV